MQVSPRFVSVTSFNEWHEGTQIETAVPVAKNAANNCTYFDYTPFKPDHYLKLTGDWVRKLTKNRASATH